ncbi:putative 50S ribosomal protein L30e [Helianthus annuus]|nr:putative 50S ribosomal protein L30e [Helianthus annuus]
MWFSSSFPQSSPLSLCKHSSQSLTKIPAARDAAGCSAATPSILPFHVKSITSTSNPFVKHCVKLRNSTSYRHSHGSVLLVGTTPIRFWGYLLMCIGLYRCFKNILFVKFKLVMLQWPLGDFGMKSDGLNSLTRLTD